MSYEFNVIVDEEGFKRASENNERMGYVAWNIAVMLAPYDTGNYRRAITLQSNTSKRTVIGYNTMNANYIQFLELGQGNVKQYKGNIKYNTRLAIAEAYIGYIQTGIIPIYSRTPNVELFATNKIFNAERRIIKSLGINSGRITADIRREISRIREKTYLSSIGKSFGTNKGLKVNSKIGTTDYQWGRSSRGIGKITSKGRSIK